MALKDKRKAILDTANSMGKYLEHNAKVLEIWRGGLLKYIEEVMKRTLTEKYFDSIRDRILPINILPRYVAKLAKAYVSDPIRKAGEPNSKEQEFVDYYTQEMNINVQGIKADSYASMFKGYAWEPYLSKDSEVKLRTIPFDRFFVMNENPEEPSEMDIFIKMVGKRAVAGPSGKMEMKEVFYAYTKDEFDAFDSEGNTYAPALVGNDGVNPFGVIPFVYGNRGDDELIPTQDQDILRFTIVIPVMMSDVAGAATYQCFSIMYGIDVNTENLTMSPNAFWSLKSDPKSDKEPKIGIIKPEVDIDQFVGLVINAFVFWLETKGIRVSGVGQMSATEVASGVSKIIDEMDTYEQRKLNIAFFKKEEEDLWAKLAVMNNYWVKNGMLKEGPGIVNEDLEVMVEFDQPEPFKSREQLIKEIKEEISLGIIGRRDAAMKLYPDSSEDEVNEMLDRADEIAPDQENANQPSNEPVQE